MIPRRCALLAPVGLFAGGLVVALAAVEIGLRLHTPVDLLQAIVAEQERRAADFRALHQRHPDRPWLYALRPGMEVRVTGFGAAHYVINADGFRGRQHQRPKPPGTFRIVVLGDSIAFGFGVDEGDAFPDQLERLLAERAGGRRVEVVNLGVSGYNPYTEAALLAEVGVTYGPDLVLVQFAPNDLTDPAAHFNASTRVALGSLPREAFPDPAWHRPTRAILITRCRALRTCALLDDRVFGWSRILLTPAPSPGDPTLRWLRARYDDMARTAGDARLAVVLFPSRGQTAGTAGRPEARIVEEGRRAGWLVIDLLPAWRLAAPTTPVYLPDDPWHPGSAGHRLAATVILEALACNGLVPVSPAGACPPMPP